MLYESTYYGVQSIDFVPSLSHHGILGMSWGKRNGPPYPLDSSDHSAAEKKAGWRKSLSRSGRTTGRKEARQKAEGNTKSKRSFKLTDRQKTALKVAGGVAVAGLAAYGAYKFGQHVSAKSVASMAKDMDIDLQKPVSDLNSTFKPEKAKIVGDLPDDILDKASKIDYSKTVEENNAGKTLKDLSDADVPKTMDDLFGDMSDSNPLKKDPSVGNNCTNVFLAACGRLMGKDVTPGYQRNSSGKYVGNDVDTVLKCFKRQTDSNGNSILKTAKSSSFDSYEKAAAVLKNPRYKYKDGSFGYLDGTFVEPRTGKEYHHAIMWKIEGSEVKFGDGIYGERAMSYFSMIKPDTKVNFFRADDNELVESEYRKRVIYH